MKQLVDTLKKIKHIEQVNFKSENLLYTICINKEEFGKEKRKRVAMIGRKQDIHHQEAPIHTKGFLPFY